MATKKTSDVDTNIVDTEIKEIKETKETKTSSVDVNAMAAQMNAMAEMIKQLQAELKNKSDNVSLNIMQSDIKSTKVLSPETIKEMERLNEKVEFRPFYDGERYKDDIFVEVNGKGYLINREKASEKPVKIPRFVYDAIIESENNKLKNKKSKDSLNRKFEEFIKRLN